MIDLTDIQVILELKEVQKTTKMTDTKLEIDILMKHNISYKG